MITGLGALAALGSVVAYSVASAGDARRAVLGAGIVALVLLAVAVSLRLPRLVPWALAAAAGGYAATRAGAHVVDGWAAAAGAGLLLAAELAYWAAGDDPRIAIERPVVVRRALTTAALVLAALVAAFVLLGVAAVSASSGLVVAAAGTAAAVSAVWLVLRLLRAP